MALCREYVAVPPNSEAGPQLDTHASKSRPAKAIAFVALLLGVGGCSSSHESAQPSELPALERCDTTLLRMPTEDDRSLLTPVLLHDARGEQLVVQGFQGGQAVYIATVSTGETESFALPQGGVLIAIGEDALLGGVLVLYQYREGVGITSLSFAGEWSGTDEIPVAEEYESDGYSTTYYPTYGRAIRGSDGTVLYDAVSTDPAGRVTVLKVWRPGWQEHVTASREEGYWYGLENGALVFYATQDGKLREWSVAGRSIELVSEIALGDGELNTARVASSGALIWRISSEVGRFDGAAMTALGSRSERNQLYEFDEFSDVVWSIEDSETSSVTIGVQDLRSGWRDYSQVALPTEVEGALFGNMYLFSSTEGLILGFEESTYERFYLSVDCPVLEEVEE